MEATYIVLRAKYHRSSLTMLSRSQNWINYYEHISIYDFIFIFKGTFWPKCKFDKIAHCFKSIVTNINESPSFAGYFLKIVIFASLNVCIFHKPNSFSRAWENIWDLRVAPFYNFLWPYISLSLTITLKLTNCLWKFVIDILTCGKPKTIE